MTSGSGDAIEVVNPRTPNGFGDEVPWFIVDGGLNEGIVHVRLEGGPRAG